MGSQAAWTPSTKSASVYRDLRHWLFSDALMSPDELKVGIESLTDTEIHSVSYKSLHATDGVTSSHADTYMNNCNRSCQQNWLTKYPRLVHSPKLDGGGGFCLYLASSLLKAEEAKGFW